MSDSDHEDVPTASNRKLFTDKYGYPAPFFLHPSIRLAGARARLTRDIERHGGTVIDTDAGADTVLVDINFQHKATLQTGYHGMSDRRYNSIWVEYARFVQNCIEANWFGHIPAERKGMGGVVGRQRKAFTTLDDEYLIQYLANLIPDPSAGGRLGTKIYENLVELGDLHEVYAWAKNHTAQSWRQRYKTQAQWMNTEIAKLVKDRQPLDKQLWPEDRRLGGMTQKQRALLQEEEEEEDENGGSDGRRAIQIAEARHEHGRDEDEVDIQPQGVSGQKRSAPLTLEQPSSKRHRNAAPPAQEPGRRLSEKARGKQRASGIRDDDEEDEEMDLQEGTSLFSIDDHSDVGMQEDDPATQPGPSRRQSSIGRSHLSSTQLPSSVFTGPTFVNSGLSHQPLGRQSDVAVADQSSRQEERIQRVDISGGTASFQNPLAQSSIRSQSQVERSAPRRAARRPKEIEQQSTDEDEEEGEQEAVGEGGIEYFEEGDQDRDQISPEPGPQPSRPRRSARRPKEEPEDSPILAEERYEEDESQPSPAFETPPPQPSPPYQAPYRNTRSRSRSVEPSTQPGPGPRARQRKKPVSKTQQPPTIPEEESLRPDLSVHRRQSGADEQDVEQLLVEHISKSSTTTDAARESSLETDDAQTRQRLQVQPADSRRGTRRNPFSSLKQPPSEMLKRIEAQDRHISSSLPATQAGTRSNQSQPTRRSMRVVATPQTQKRSERPPTKTTTNKKTRQRPGNRHESKEPPRTPARPTRRDSQSDGSDFPYPGTLASAKKQELQAREKSAPFRPSLGTRAAEWVQG